MVVLAIFGIVAVAASMTFASMLRSVKKSRGALQAMTGTRATLEFVMEEGRNAGGPDLPENARVLIDKGGGQRGTDVLWIMRQNIGYSACAITQSTESTITLTTLRFFDNNGVLQSTSCCLEAGPPFEDGKSPPLAGSVAEGAPFRRTAVLTDQAGRFIPVFLSGAPNSANCAVNWAPLPGISNVVRAEFDNMPQLNTFAGGEAILADVKRFYVDFDAERVKPPFGALYLQNELDGDLTNFADERQRLSSNTYDFRASVGYDDPQPQVVEDEAAGDEDDGEALPLDPPADEVPAGNQALIERIAARGGWRDAPVRVVEGGEVPPVMLGVAIQTGVAGDRPPEPLPWSTRPRLGEPAQVMSLVGRITFRSEAR